MHFRTFTLKSVRCNTSTASPQFWHSIPGVLSLYPSYLTLGLHRSPFCLAHAHPINASCNSIGVKMTLELYDAQVSPLCHLHESFWAHWWTFTFSVILWRVPSVDLFAAFFRNEVCKPPLPRRHNPVRQCCLILCVVYHRSPYSTPICFFITAVFLMQSTLSAQPLNAPDNLGWAALTSQFTLMCTEKIGFHIIERPFHHVAVPFPQLPAMPMFFFLKCLLSYRPLVQAWVFLNLIPRTIFTLTFTTIAWT